MDFNTLAAGWNRIRANGAPNLKRAVAGLIDPSRIVLQRVGETPTDLTIAFRGFDQALENTDRDAPLLKRALLAWVKELAPAQIDPGDPGMLTLRIRKSPPVQTAEPQQAPQPDPVRQGDLAQISNVRKVNG